MRKHTFLITALLSLAAVSCAKQSHPEEEMDYGPGFWSSEFDTTNDDIAGGETHSELPDQNEMVLQKDFFAALVQFPQTQWNECTDKATGQYLTFGCAEARNISVILDRFLQGHLLACVDKGMAAQGGGTARSVHLIHAGITGDPNHSPKSLHSHNRAIDIKVIKAKLTNGTERQFTYSKVGNRPFYTALRKCWGETVHTQNSCPYYSSNSMLTGSIGWENSAHGLHMHLSVPYCVRGNYGSGVWVR